jgi:DNA-binding LacI/PurR family transcriptional regulator
MERARLSTDGLIVEGDFSEQAGVTGAIELLDRDVDAIFCANDSTAAGALDSIRTRALRVPDDVALAGFDDLEFAAHLDPPLTTIRQGVRDQGSEAAHTLFELVRDPEGGPRRVILPTELIIRQSTMGGVQSIERSLVT